VLQLVQKTIAKHALLSAKDSVALAISGGKDSVAAAYLLEELGIPFVMVHVNFCLRGNDSDGDEEFVKELENQLSQCTAVYSKTMKTKAYASSHKLGIQEAARQLRYDYFDSLKAEGVFTKLITAHHASDQLETFFINLYRVSGINGLKGMPIQRDYIIRPFLEVPQSDVLDYIKKNNIKYREDKSNADSQYLRNKIRNRVLPGIQEELPDFKKRAKQSIAILNKENEAYNYLINNYIHGITAFRNNVFEIQKMGILSFPQRAVLLYQILDRYGFNYGQCEQISDACEGTAGKFFESAKYTLSIDRNYLYLTTTLDIKPLDVPVTGVGKYSIINATIELQKTVKATFNANPNTESVSINDSYFPLVLRFWKEGDTIQPLGMKGTKLVSDFFIDLKIPLHQKQKIPLICVQNEVLWACGYRISEKIKVDPKVPMYTLLCTFET
jgi:tRNA(Ile)-lysidine synthase